MPLINLKTELKSLKYGNDTPGGGDSGQPYIKTDINNVDRGFNQLRLTKFDDGLIRGGAIGAINASVVDTLRIGKFLTDFPKGPLFIAKQVGLQLSNPKIETKPIPSLFGGTTTGIGGLINRGINLLNNNKIGPTRIYNLGLNTIAQIPVNAFGQHFNRHGFTPVQDENTKYFSVVKDNNEKGFNRLVKLKNTLIGIDTSPDIINRNKIFNIASSILPNLGFNLPFVKRFNETQIHIDDYIGGPGSVYGIGRTLIKRYDFTGTKDKNKIPFSEEENISNKIDLSILQGLNPNGPSLSYPEGDSESRFEFGGYISEPNVINYGSPSIKNYQKIKESIDNLKNITISKAENIKTKSNIILNKGNSENGFTYNGTNLDGVFDRIDSKILQVVFKIITANNTGGNRINLSAYMNGFKDNFNASWNEVNYNGRSDSFYIYNKGKRNVSFNLQIPCFNKTQLLEKHRALGQLASTTAGTYNDSFLQGVLFQLNVGNYLVGEYAILNDISYSIPENATWDIDEKLATYIEASFSFTIIHQDLPQYQPNEGFFKYLRNPILGYLDSGYNTQDEANKVAGNFNISLDQENQIQKEKLEFENREKLLQIKTSLLTNIETNRRRETPDANIVIPNL
jgi:hypothetical protein